jgi:hypothetical protein
VGSKEDASNPSLQMGTEAITTGGGDSHNNVTTRDRKTIFFIELSSR